MFSRLEDVKHPLLGPNIRGLQGWGLLQPTRFDQYIYNTIHFLVLLFVISQFIELWIIKSDLEMALRNLAFTIQWAVCLLKVTTFVVWQKSWNDLIKFVSDTEIYQLSKNDIKTNRIIAKYTGYARKITCFYWCVAVATAIFLLFAPWFGFLSSPSYRERIKNGTASYPQIFSSWVPFDATRGFGYCLITVEHILFCFYGTGVVANYDSNAFVIMTFFAGQLHLLSANCARLFDEDESTLSYEEVVKRIKYCHCHHLNLIKYSNILNSLLSPVMFLYVIICSLMICASAVLLTMENFSTAQRVWVAEYFLALITQLFLYCWHSNEVMYMSDNVSYGVYESSWWSQSVRVRRSVLLLSGQLCRPILFYAGPFTQLNVATFVAILKGAYSYYTLLSKKD